MLNVLQTVIWRHETGNEIIISWTMDYVCRYGGEFNGNRLYCMSVMHALSLSVTFNYES